MWKCNTRVTYVVRKNCPHEPLVVSTRVAVFLRRYASRPNDVSDRPTDPTLMVIATLTQGKVGEVSTTTSCEVYISFAADAMEKLAGDTREWIRDGKSDDENDSRGTIFALFSELSWKIFVDVAPSDTGSNPFSRHRPRTRKSSRARLNSTSTSILLKSNSFQRNI